MQFISYTHYRRTISCICMFIISWQCLIALSLKQIEQNNKLLGQTYSLVFHSTTERFISVVCIMCNHLFYICAPFLKTTVTYDEKVAQNYIHNLVQLFFLLVFSQFPFKSKKQIKFHGKYTKSVQKKQKLCWRKLPNPLVKQIEGFKCQILLMAWKYYFSFQIWNSICAYFN